MKNKPQDPKETRPTEPVHKIDGEGSGRHVKDVIPDDEDESSIGQKLAEEGMPGPTVAPLADDQRRK